MEGRPEMGGSWGQVQAGSSRAATRRAEARGVGLALVGLLQVSGAGVIYPPHEDRELVLLVPEHKEEGLLHFKDQQTAGHRDSRGCSRLHPALRQLQYGLVLHRRKLQIRVLCQPAQVDVVGKVKEF